MTGSVAGFSEGNPHTDTQTNNFEDILYLRHNITERNMGRELRDDYSLNKRNFNRIYEKRTNCFDEFYLR